MRLVFAALAAAFVLISPARAETYRLDYEAVVLGIVVLGEVRYEIAASPGNYTARASVRTSGLARLFDQTDITASSAGAINGAALSWSRYQLSHSYASKSRRILLNRAARGVSAEIAPTYGNMGAPPASPAQQMGSYDPLSGVFALGRQIGAARTCQGAVLVFDGRQHYRLSVAPRARGTFNGGGYDGPAVSCRFLYEPIAGFSEDFDRSNIPAAEAWFALPSDSGFAAPLRLTVPTPLGDAQLDLRGFERIE